MVSVVVDRGLQLNHYRQDKILTDVVLKSSNTSLPCHKLLLSLHSPYFRTLFQSTGFVESNQNTIELTHIKPDLLEAVVIFLYTGKLEITKECAVELLEVVTILQLDENELIEEVKTVLIEEAKQADSFQELFYLWNTAVTYDLEQVVEVVLSVVEVKLEQFITSPTDRSWLAMLGWEEMIQVLDRDGLCVQSEASLLELAVFWAKDKVETEEDYCEWLQLLQSVRLTLVDKKYVKQQLAKNFPLFSSLRPRMPKVTYARTCYNCIYLVQYKLTKTQLRNIEDFIDKGEKSLFLGFNLAGHKMNKLTSMSRMSSMVGTAAGNYSRPITTGSRMFQYKDLVVVIGGQVDSDPEKIRTDILVYSTKTDYWLTSLKQYIRSRPRSLLHDIVMVGASIYLIWVPTKPPTTEPVNQSVMNVLMDTRDKCAVVEKLDLKKACDDHILDRQVVGEVPEDLWTRQFSCEKVLNNIYCVAEGSTWLFNTVDQTWSKLPPPIGTMGRARPVMSFNNPLLYMVGGRQDDSTNSVQVMDTETNTWRRLPNLSTRLSPLDMFCHCGKLFIVGWQPARNNFIMSMDKETGIVEVVLEGMEGAWSRGMVGRGDTFVKLIDR